MIEYWNYPRSAAGLLVLVEFAVRHGMRVADALESSRISRADLQSPDVEIAAAQELRVIANIMGALPDALQLGIDVGLEYNFATFGIWGLALVSHATGRDALALALRFLPLTHAFTAILLNDDGDRAVLCFSEPDLPADMQDFVVARDMVTAALLLREVIGQDFALTGFDMKASTHASAHSALPRLFGATARTDAPLNRLMFEPRFLDRPLPRANPVTAAMCEMLCRQRLEQQKRGLKTGALSFRYQNTDAGKPPSNLGAFAHLANMSERTLKRRLKAEGTSFRVLSANSRRALAETLLAADLLSIGDIAERLEFSDLSSFSQAFKRWSGIAPSIYRKRIREMPVDPDQDDAVHSGEPL